MRFPAEKYEFFSPSNKIKEESSMRALSLQHGLRSVRDAIAQWWRNRFGIQSELSELECCGADEVARDPGLSASDLLALSSHRPGVDSLLRRRMETLHLDPNELAQSDPLLVGELQRLCAMC